MGQPFVPLLVHVAAPLCATPAPAPERAPAVPPPDLEALRQAALEEGRREAAALYEPQLRELEARLAAVAPLLQEVARLRREALSQAAADVASLVVGVAHKVIGDSLTVHPDALPRLVHSALARLPDEDEIWIRVPAQAVERVAATVPERHRARVVADPALETGCVVQTRHASIDASLETAVAGLTEATGQWLAGRTA